MDEFGEKLLEELDYVQEGRNLVDFYENFKDDPIVKIPKFYPEYSGKKVLVMEWIDGVRCTNSKEICDTLDVDEFIRVGVVSGLRQLLEFGLFHGDPHPREHLCDARRSHRVRRFRQCRAVDATE